jgi:hypothetical protein
MSLTKKDRKFRSGSGKGFLPGGEPPQEEMRFAIVVANALRREFGDSAGAVKEVARLTRANERAAKNWFDAKNAPNGALLIRLIEHSDDVLESVLTLARRQELLKEKRIHDTRRELLELLSQLHVLLSLP